MVVNWMRMSEGGEGTGGDMLYLARGDGERGRWVDIWWVIQQSTGITFRFGVGVGGDCAKCWYNQPKKTTDMRIRGGVV